MRRAADLLLPSLLLLNRPDFIGMIPNIPVDPAPICRHLGIAGIAATYLHIIRPMTFMPAASPSEKFHFLP
jgi:hypothetical protein